MEGIKKSEIKRCKLSQRIDRIVETLEKYGFWLYWLRWFYPQAKGIPLFYLLYFFIPQKIFRINGGVPWPVHFTSRILYHKNIMVGNNSAPGLTGCCYIQARNGIVIGHNLRMGPGVGLISSNHSTEDYDMHVDKGPIVIGNDVWLGMNVVILPGLKIGDNVIVGANSVVTKDLPSNVIAAGNPCRVIREKGPYKGKDYGKLS